MLNDKAPLSAKATGDKHRQQILIGASIVLVLLAYLTYVKMKGSGAAGSKGATVTPVSSSPDPESPMPTATSIPSGSAAPQTTVPYAAPTDTTGGAPYPSTSGTPTQGAPSETVPPVTKPTVATPKTTGTITKPPQAQSKPTVATPSAYHPASHPALISPLLTPHPNGSAAMPGGAGFQPLGATVHPATNSGQA